MAVSTGEEASTFPHSFQLAWIAVAFAGRVLRPLLGRQRERRARIIGDWLQTETRFLA